MRRGAILVGIIAAIVGSQSDATAQSYPLACRGPLTVEFGQNHQPSLTMTFARGRKPATQGVDPGSCAWMDRGVRSTEPTCLQHSPTDVRVRMLQAPPADRPSGAAAEPFRFEVTGTVRGQPGGAQTDPGALRVTPPRFEIKSPWDAPYLESISTTSAKSHIFQAHSKQGHACLQVERLGP